MALEHNNMITTHVNQHTSQFSSPNSPNSSIILNINANMLLDVIETPIVETHKKMGILFQACTIYKWIHNQCVLVNCCDFVCNNANEGSYCKCGFCGIQQHPMHDNIGFI
jgi:hypothetical protein